MPVQEFLFTVDPRTDKNLSSINEQLRSLTNREDPLTLDNFISFDVIGYSGLRSVVIRVTMEVNAFYARTTFPLNGSAFSQATAPQAIKLVFNSKVNEGSITDTSIKYNGTSVAASNITLESDGYTLSVNTSGPSYNALQTHTVELISLKDRKGNGLSKQDVFSYVVGTSGSATSDRGNPEPYTYHDKIGDFKVTSFVIDRYAKIADKITEYLKTNSIDRNSVIAQDILNVNENTLEVYILYFSDLFPSVIRTFPQEGALVSSDGVPTEAVITFSQPTHVNITETNNITIGGVDISASAILSDDKKTVKVGIGSISAGNHFIKINNVYNELGRIRPNPPIAIGFTAADIADNGNTGGGTGTPAISGIAVDVGTQIDGVSNPLITLGGDTFVTVSGTNFSEIALLFDETQINHANIQGGNFSTPSNISPAVTNQFISAITFNTHGHVASVVRSGVVPASIDHGSLGGLSDNDHPQYFLSGSFNSPGIVISDGDGTITINAADASNIGQWDTAYGWGDHGTIGYLTAFTETDPVFSAHIASDITSTDTTNWTAAYTHSQISAANPHGVSIDNINGGTFADLDTAVTDADLAKSGDNISNFANNVPYLTAHPAVSGASNTTNNNPTFIQNLTFDTNGHVITVSSVSITPPVIGALDASNVSGPGVIVSTGSDSGVITTSTVNDFVSGSVISGVNISGTVTSTPGGTSEIIITGLVPDSRVLTDVPAGAVFTDTVYTAFDTDFSNKSTANLSEVTNLYYTDARARGAFSAGTNISISVSGEIAVSATLGNLAALSTVGTTQIDDDSVTFAKMQNITQDRIIGRVSASPADPEELTAAQVRTFINIAAGTTEIEDGADVTDATNVDAAGAVMETDSTVENMSFKTGVVTADSTKFPTAAAVKTYADRLIQITASDGLVFDAETVGLGGNFALSFEADLSPGDILYIDSNTSVTGEASGSSNNGKFLQQGNDGYPVWTAVDGGGGGGGGGATELSGLTDVNIDVASASAGSLFYYNGTTWATLDPPNSVDHLLISTGAAANMPYWTGAVERLTGTWLNSSELSQIGDVENSPQNGEVLVYDGGSWVGTDTSTLGGGGATDIGQLDDVTITNVSGMDSLVWDTSVSKFVNRHVHIFVHDFQFESFTEADNIHGNTITDDVDDTYTAPAIPQTEYNTDIIEPGYESTIEEVHVHMSKGGVNLTLFQSMDYSIYPISVTGGVHTTGSVLATGNIVVDPTTTIDSPTIINSFTGDNIYLKLVPETGHYANVVLAGLANYYDQVYIDYIGIESTIKNLNPADLPGGSTANMPKNFNHGDLSDVFFNKNTTGDQTILGSLTIAAGKTLTVTKTPGSTLDAANKSYVDGLNLDAIHNNVNSEISSLTEKTTPVSADLLIIEDSAASNAKKRIQIGNLPSSGGGGGDSTQPEAFAWFVG